MNLSELYNSLLTAYSTENLNLITGKLIALYKNRNYGKIRDLANKVSKYVPIEEENGAKCFTKLIVLYHPDKGDQIRKTLQQLYEQQDREALNRYAHIFQLDSIDDITVVTIDEDVEYRPEYGWDTPTEDGYSFYDYAEEGDGEGSIEDMDFERSFYNLVKLRQYGSVSIEFPTYYLEDFEEFEMAYSGLESLDGVEYCIHVKTLDVSNNDISDIESLWGLEHLEELYLANNQIGYIDTLSSLVKLKTLDISGNQIDDVTPLLELDFLEFVNLIGNPVPYDQIEALEQNGVVVLTDQVNSAKLELE